MKNGVRNQDLGAKCICATVVIASRSSQLKNLRNICVYILMYTYIPKLYVYK